MTVYRGILKVTADILLLIFVCGITAGAESNRVTVRVIQPVDPENRITLHGNTHPLARPEFDRGAAPDSLPMNRILLVLQRSPQQEAALRQLLDDQQTISSPRYHQWLTPDDFGREFGPADADIQAVTDWLTAEGFQVNRVAAGRTVIEFSGTAGLVRQALHTEIHKFVVNGEEHWANASDPQIPAALAPVVAGIDSLHNFQKKPMYVNAGHFSKSMAAREEEPLLTLKSSTGATSYALGPGDLGVIYNIEPLWHEAINGSAQTIAIVAQSSFDPGDEQEFTNLFGVTGMAQTVIDGPNPGLVPGDETEADTDVEWSAAAAPGALVDLVVSESTESSAGTDLSAFYIVDNNLAPVMSESYGSCEAALGVGGNAFYNTLWEQGAGEGITIVVAAGDNGSAACDQVPGETVAAGGLAVNGIASTPFNVAVGGTDFDDVTNASTYWSATNTSGTLTSAKSYIPETTWNDSCAGLGAASCAGAGNNPSDVAAGGGGPSNCGMLTGVDPHARCSKGYAKPSWQTGSGVPKDGVRDVPDVSLFSSNGHNKSFYVVCEADLNTSKYPECDAASANFEFEGIGGTSVAAPIFAGIMAIVDGKYNERQGNANYILYKLAARKNASCASNSSAVSNSSCTFYDVVSGNNSVACKGASPDCSNKDSSGFGVEVSPSSASTEAWAAGAGYDLATGLGSVNAANLVDNWTSVAFAPTTTTITSLSPTTLTHGQPVNVSVSVSSTSGTPTGEITLLGDVNSGGFASVLIADFALSNGLASGITSFLPGGAYYVTARYSGDGSFGASTSPLPGVFVTVNPEKSATKVGLVTFDFNTGAVTSFNATTAPYGSPYVLRADVTNSAGQECSRNPVPCPTGTVTLKDNGKPLDLGAYALNSQGYTEDQPIQLAAGSYNVVASYGGDQGFLSSSSGTVPVTITKALTGSAIAGNPSPVSFGENVTLTATVSTQSNGAAPTGTVQFLSGSTALQGKVTYSAVPGSTSSVAVLQATLVASLASTANITAKYSGDANYSSSASTSTPITVSPGFTQSISPASVTISAPGQSGMATLKVASGGGLTGAIAFSCVIPATMHEAACAFNPASLSASGTSALTITTTAEHTVGRMFPVRPRWFWPLLAIVGLLFVMAARARWRRPALAFALLVAALATAGLAGCGGGGGGGGGPTTDPGTAAGTYTIMVMAADGSISHTANVTVTVK